MLHFKVKGEGRALILIHGYLESSQMWTKYVEELSSDYQLIYPDLPGHGLSKVYSKVHTMEFMAEKIREVIDFLKLDKVLLVGHSMGGYVGLAFTELFPEKVQGLILMNSSSLADTNEKKELRNKAILMADKNQSTLVSMSIPLLFNKHRLHELKQESEFAKGMALKTPLEGVKSALRGMQIRTDRTFILHNFSNRIGIIVGNHDRTVPPKEFKLKIPNQENISLLELECGHMAYLEEPIKTLHFIKEFAQKVYE